MAQIFEAWNFLVIHNFPPKRVMKVYDGLKSKVQRLQTLREFA